MAYLLTELESLINIRVVGLQVFFLEHLESSDLNICSKGYDLNTKMCVGPKAFHSSFDDD